FGGTLIGCAQLLGLRLLRCVGDGFRSARVRGPASLLAEVAFSRSPSPCLRRRRLDYAGLHGAISSRCLGLQGRVSLLPPEFQTAEGLRLRIAPDGGRTRRNDLPAQAGLTWKPDQLPAIKADDEFASRAAIGEEDSAIDDDTTPPP